MKNLLLHGGLAAFCISLSMQSSALEIIGSEAGSNFKQDKTTYHQFHQGVSVFDLSNREGIVSVINKANRELGGSIRLKDRASANEPAASFYYALMKLFAVTEMLDIEKGMESLEIAYLDGQIGSVEKREAALLLSDIYSGHRVISTSNNLPMLVSAGDKARAPGLVYDAAISDHPVAQRRLAQYYWDGLSGYPRDRELAFYWMNKSSSLGDKASLEKWEEWNSELVDARHVSVLKEEVSRGQTSALVGLAKHYFDGKGVTVDKVKAVRLATEAHKMGEKSAKTVLDAWGY
jgi:TPR repeat protein